jgi:hypothetical protein
MKTGLGLCAIGAACLALGSGGPCPDLTIGIILIGNGGPWNVIEPESWITVALFFLVTLTSAGVLVNRLRKAVGR